MRMRVLAAVVVLVGAMSIPILSRPAHAATADQLAKIALTSSEIGGGYEEIHSGPVDDLAAANVPSYAGAWMKSPSFLSPSLTVVSIVLIDAEAAELAGPAAAGGAGALDALGLTLTPAGSAGLGEESQRFSVAGEIVGVAVKGEAIAWKQSGISVAVFIFSNEGSPSAMPIAQLQADKIAALSTSV